MKRTRLFIYSILVIGIFSFSLTGCTSYTFSYKPNRIKNERLELPVFTQANIDVIKINAGNNPNLEMEIKNSLIDEMDQVFSKRVENKEKQHDINVLINVKHLQLTNEPWGLIPPLFVLMFVGGPSARNVSTTDLEVLLYDNRNNTLIKSYTCRKEIAKWRGAFWGENNILFTSPSNIVYRTIQSAMDEIKTNIIADRAEINKYWTTENRGNVTKQLSNGTVTPFPNSSAIEKMKQLKEMLDNGIVTQKEYDQKKKSIIDGL